MLASTAIGPHSASAEQQNSRTEDIPGFDNPELPPEVYHHLAHLRWCIFSMFTLSLLRLLVEPNYAIGSMVELVVATASSNVLRIDTMMGPPLGKLCSCIPDCYPVTPCDKMQAPRGLGTLRLLIGLSLLGCLSELRHSMYMRSANVSTMSLVVPIFVYSNALLYFAVFMLILKVKVATWNVHCGDYYATTAVANANVGRPEPISDDEELRQAIEASRQEAPEEEHPTPPEHTSGMAQRAEGWRLDPPEPLALSMRHEKDVLQPENHIAASSHMQVTALPTDTAIAAEELRPAEEAGKIENDCKAHQLTSGIENNPEEHITQTDRIVPIEIADNSEAEEEQIRRAKEESLRNFEEEHLAAPQEAGTNIADTAVSESEEEQIRRAKEKSFRELEAIRLKKQSEYNKRNAK